MGLISLLKLTSFLLPGSYLLLLRGLCLHRPITYSPRGLFYFQLCIAHKSNLLSIGRPGWRVDGALPAIEVCNHF